jgi:hypothetical protein
VALLITIVVLILQPCGPVISVIGLFRYNNSERYTKQRAGDPHKNGNIEGRGM